MTTPQGSVGFNCPGCGSPRQSFGGIEAFMGTQAFCPNDACRIVTWNPEKTLDENLDDFGVLDLKDLP